MVVITRKKSGRGYTREEWIDHHNRIVQRAKKKETSQTKLTESWNNSTTKDTGKKPAANSTRKRSEQDSDETEPNETIIGETNNTQSTRKLKNPTQECEGENTKGSTTQEVYVDTKTHEKNTQKLRSIDELEIHEIQGLQLSEQSEQNHQRTHHGRNEETTAPKDFDTEKTNQRENDSHEKNFDSGEKKQHQESEPRGKQGYGRTWSNLDTVEIKQEFLDEATSDKKDGWTNTSKKSNSDYSEMLEDAMDTDSLMTEDTDKEYEEEPMAWHLTQRSSTTISKRKLDTAHQMKYKRLQIASEELLDSKYESQKKENSRIQSLRIESTRSTQKKPKANDVRQLSSNEKAINEPNANIAASSTGQSVTEIIDSDDNMTVNESDKYPEITNATKVNAVSSLQQATVQSTEQKSDLKKISTSENTVVASQKTTDMTQTESDMEWEEIAQKIASYNPRSKPSSRPQNSSGKKIVPNQKHTRFSKFNTVIKTNTRSEETNQEIKARGWNMTERMEKITTPIKIEYNISSDVREFNIIQACKELFDTMGQVDPSIRIFSSVDKEQLWEVNSPILENDEFERLYQMRTQNFRNGNTKVTTYGIVESQYNINKMTFTDPVKRLLTEKNIWVKPDFYSTKVVNSPGFFTMIHPKLTNKQAYTKYLHNAMTETSIDQTEQVCIEWRDKGSSVERDETTLVPKFHLETTLRKWGKTQADVVSVHCSSTDAKYMKYLLAEASSQGKLDKGVFVPSGIHLMEGKQVLTQIIQEQQNFIQDIESFQIGGISEDEMYSHSQGHETIEQILLNGPGVQAVEPTYQTAYKGQWTLVVKGRQTRQLTEHIKLNITKIYKNKTGQQLRLVTHQIEKYIPGYKFALVEQMVSRVGTYAEVLRRRFTPSTTAPQMQVSKQADQKDKYTAGMPHADTRNRPHTTANNTGNPEYTRPSRPTTEYEEYDTGRQVKQTAIGAKVIEATRKNHREQTNTKTKENESERNKDGPTQEEVDTWNHKLQSVDDTINSRLARFEKENTQLMQNLEKNIEAQVDRLMEKRMKAISNVVGDAVTKRIMGAMERMINKVKQQGSTIESNMQQATVTQDSPFKEGEQTRNDTAQTNYTENDTTDKIDSTKMMLTELESIANNQPKINDPTHDINNQGSEIDKT